MQLKLKDVAKIKEATINMDGITVIAGENNTGKSTIGKVLFSIFNSMYNMEDKIMSEKKKRIEQIIEDMFPRSFVRQKSNTGTYNGTYHHFLYTPLNQIMDMNVYNDLEKLKEILLEATQNTSLKVLLDNPEEWVQECLEKISLIVNISTEKIVTEITTRWFDKVFEEQFSPLNQSDIVSEIYLKIKDKSLNYNFKNDTCTNLNTELNILHQAFYIDNPFIIDSLFNEFSPFNTNITDFHLLDYLSKEKGIYDDIFDAVIAKEKLMEINSILSEIIEGEILKTNGNKYYLISQKYDKPLNIKNLSTGLKSFVLIKRLLETGSLKEKDVLILDEPEVHLHPEWQLAYAELIVLLQKKFDLTIIITTHSPYFLDAIDVFSAKHKLSDRVNYYLAENSENVSYLHNVTNNIDIIYKKLSDPLQKLENIRNGLL